jgi:rhamnogalacturonan endolyase
VRGQLALTDPLAPGGAKMSNVRVGLTAAAWKSPMPAGPSGIARMVDWQQDAKNYQFWTRASDDGRFEIPNVRPGAYTLRAFADGVLGEFAKADVTLAAGKVDLGKIVWTPIRHGKQLWDIGIANRNGSELFRGESYWEPEIPLDYAKLFPNDVTFVVGKSDYRKDWFFQQVPHNETADAKSEPFYGIRAAGRATPFAVTFDLAAAVHGRAALRLALCGTATRQLEVTVNDQPAGVITLPMGDSAIARHGRQGLWYERELAFDASMLKPGNNVLKIIVPAGPINNGILYDYVRLELDEAAPSGAAPRT